jgi:flagellar biosynthesis/type III secretory pathway protein FliH
MTWSDNRGGQKRRVKPAIFVEKVQVKKPVPAWVSSQQNTPHTLSGWLSSRSVAPPNPATSAPPAPPIGPTTEKRIPASPSTHPSQRGSAAPSVIPSAEGMVQAMEARALTFGQAESVTQASRSAFPQPPDRSFEGTASHLGGSSAFLAAEAAQMARLDATISALEKSVEELSLLRGRMMEETEEQLVTLAATIAQRVIGREISLDPEILLTLAAEGIDALGDRDRVVVRFGFLDRDDLLASMVDRLKRRAPRCEVLQDPSLGPGQCIVESEFGQVDESVDARLDNVVRALLPSAPRRFGLT